ncbi:F-box protein [Musa troglodytarum]|uniref:F-box protein n=1 Tax=Musa troglodytarum TaxID=320322 RepID=A0A9E7FW62_9LILI|nr:F-box protein [Musa troglodytarum]
MQPSPLPAEDAVVGRSPPPSHDGCRNPDAGSSDGTGALLLVLGYLRLPDLLAFQRVSRFFRDAVAGDGLLWRRIAVQSPLSGRLTDDALLRITSRAEGKLESLALMDCWRITDDGLMQVVHRNPGITKDCGGCLDFYELGEETVCSHLLCVKCWLDLPKCNICNRPYCKGHPNFLEGSSKFLGFVCEQCMESTSSSYHSTCDQVGWTLFGSSICIQEPKKGEQLATSFASSPNRRAGGGVGTC